MKLLLRWIGIVLGTVLALGIVACGAVYALSEHTLRRRYEVRAATIFDSHGSRCHQ